MALILLGKVFHERTAVKRVYMIIGYNDNPSSGKHFADIRGSLRQYVIFDIEGIAVLSQVYHKFHRSLLLYAFPDYLGNLGDFLD